MANIFEKLQIKETEDAINIIVPLDVAQSLDDAQKLNLFYLEVEGHFTVDQHPLITYV